MWLWSSVPVSLRPIVIVVGLVALFFMLSVLGQPQERVPTYGPRAATRMKSVCKAIVDSHRAAIQAPDVYQQLMYIHWSQAMLESLRTLAGNDTHLSQVVGLSIEELRNRLKRDEKKCMDVL